MRPYNKRILMMCKETYSYPLYYLAREWKRDNEIAAFFFNPTETKYNECDLNDTTYYKFLEDPGVIVYNSNHIADEFTEHYNSPIIDNDELKCLESQFSHFKNFNLQILTTQYFTRHYHFRNYFVECTYEQQMYWLVLNYRHILNIIDEFKPDIIIDTDSAELARAVLIEVAYNKKIPYLTLEYPRYETFKTISYRQGYGIDEYFIETYEKLYKKSQECLKEEYRYVGEFRSKTNIMSSEFKGDVTASYKADSVFQILKNLADNIHYFYNQDYEAKNLELKRTNKVLYPDSWEYIKFYTRYYFTKRKLMHKNKYFVNPVEGEDYIYMPLHLIPESSTSVKAPFYIDELNIIEAVSKALPAGWYLYVKEHQSMVGERGIDFYERASKIPNVKLVQLNYYQDPKPWIQNSRGVVTITGTTAYEAALMGKRAFVFGDVMFQLIDGITRVNSIEDLPGLLKMCVDTTPLDNIHSCASYIAAVKEVGEPVNIKTLLKEPLLVLRFEDELSEDAKCELRHLKNLFERYM